MSGVIAAIQKAEAEASSKWAGVENGARAVLREYGPLIDQYRGPIPASMVAVRIQIECGGNPKASVPSTGEKGLLMLWPATQQKYGVTDPFDPAQNLRAGLLHWQEELSRMRNKLPGLFPSENYDYFACGQLYTMIGGGATPYLLKKAGVSPGDEYTDLVNWLKAQGENLEQYKSSFGSQSAATVARRIIYAGFMTDVARSIGGFGSGLMMIGLAVVALAGYFIWKWWK